MVEMASWYVTRSVFNMKVRDAQEAHELRVQYDEMEQSTEALPRPHETKKVLIILIHFVQVRGVRFDHQSSVFVQYYELYNEFAYDLLEETPEGQMCDFDIFSWKFSPQKRALHGDASNMVYVEGAVEVEVNSADEALRVFYHGEERRRTSDTLLNQQSSRSHAVFSIRVVQAPVETDTSYPVTDPSKIIIGQLALVDLAGSERAKRTKNVGDRLMEAGKINNSLMVLRQCLDKLRCPLATL